MNEAEKERLIKKDLVSIENRVRHAFNQGYEMGLKESSLEKSNTCDDAISRDADYDLSMGQVVRGIHALPPVVSQPKVGKWIKNEEYDGYETTLTDCTCSICGENALLKKSYSMDGQSIVLCPSNYCPNCGAKMQEV